MSIYQRWKIVTNDNESFLRFECVETKKSNRPDLHAFLLLNELFPKNRDMVSGAGHDQIWLDVSEEDIEKLSDENILEISRSGVFYDYESNALSMFV